MKFISEELEKLINEYKETTGYIEGSRELLTDKDYAIGKLDLVKTSNRRP